MSRIRVLSRQPARLEERHADVAQLPDTARTTKNCTIGRSRTSVHCTRGSGVHFENRRCDRFRIIRGPHEALTFAAHLDTIVAMVAELLRPPAEAQVIETCGGCVWLTNGIVHEAVGVAHLKLKHVQGLAAGVRALVGDDTQSLLLADMCRVRSASSDARAYSASAELQSLVAAQAFIVTSPVTRVITSFFVRVFHPPFPVRLFSGVAPASDWLHGLRPVANA